MDFRVATDDNGFMVRHWLSASAANGSPADFVVDAQGKIAWIGNPADIDQVLPKIWNKDFSVSYRLTLKRIFLNGCKYNHYFRIWLLK